MRNEVLRVQCVFKYMNTYPVLSGISFAVEAGQGLCIIADTQDTKTGLLQLLCGEIQPDAGKIYIDDESVSLTSSEDAKNKGIFYIDNEKVFGNLDVASNLFLTNTEYYHQHGVARKSKMLKDTEHILREYSLTDINPAARTDMLSEEEILCLMVLKAVTMKAKVIVFDESYKRLSENEVLRFKRFCEKIKKKGIAIVFIMNQMDYRMQMFETLSVIKNRATVQTVSMEEEKDAISDYVPLPVEPVLAIHHRDEHEVPVFAAKQIQVEELPRNWSLNFEIYKGEVLGICDPSWSVLPLLKDVILGQRKYAGDFLLNGETVSFDTGNAYFEYKVACIFSKSKYSSVFEQMNIYDNITMLQKNIIYNRLGMLNRRYQKYIARHYLSLIHAEDLLVNYSKKKNLLNMSAGDQLRLEIVRWLCLNPNLYIFYRPCDSFSNLTKKEFESILKDLLELQLPVLILSDSQEYLQMLSDRVVYIPCFR